MCEVMWKYLCVHTVDITEYKLSSRKFCIPIGIRFGRYILCKLSYRFLAVSGDLLSWFILWFSSVPRRKFRGINLKIFYDSFLSHPLQFITSFIISFYCTSQILRFIQIECLCQPCFQQVYRRPFFQHHLLTSCLCVTFW
jgi:hypothetical protein